MTGKVLIVDDNPDIVALLRANLRMAGFETVEALDGEVALRRVDQERPDVILLDLMMPVLDGWGVLEALKDRPDRPPVVVVTAAESPANVDRAQRLGVSGYVTKPFNLVSLIDLVRSLIAGNPRPDPNVAGRTRRRR
jgi:two-component system, OmpR family, response regulator PrrA